MERTTNVHIREECESRDEAMTPAGVLLNVELECVKRECDRLRDQMHHERESQTEVKTEQGKEVVSETSGMQISQELIATRELLRTKEREILEFQKYKEEWLLREKNLQQIVNEVEIFGMTEI